MIKTLVDSVTGLQKGIVNSKNPAKTKYLKRQLLKTLKNAEPSWVKSFLSKAK